MLLLGGSGERFKSRIPKQFVKLSSSRYPLFLQTLLSLTEHLQFEQIILVVNSQFIDKLEFIEPLREFEASHPGITINIAISGENRHQSFLSGASFLPVDGEQTALAVHDANRPFISGSFAMEIHSSALKLSAEKPCFIPVLPVTDSLCGSDNGQIVKYIPRSHVMSIQTPQLIYLPALREAIKLKQQRSPVSDFTDEGSFMLEMGFPVFTFPGDPSNKKITYAEDVP